MRVFNFINFGTEGYPEKIARRLRAMNIAAWIAAAVVASFAIRRLLDPSGEKLQPGLANGAAAILLACLPLLHRISPLAGPAVFVAFIYPFFFWVSARGGTDGGAWLNYITAVPLTVLLFGTERLVLTAVFAAVSVTLIVLAHIYLPDYTGYVSVQSQFYGNFVVTVVVTIVLIFIVIHYAMRQVYRAEADAEREYRRSESLLVSILPEKIAERLKSRPGQIIADRYDEASVLLADLAGFTKRASRENPEILLRFLNEIFGEFDKLVEEFGLEKIKTTGDSYLVVSGIPDARPDHALVLADFAIALRDRAATLRDAHGKGIAIRIGMASGSVVAGVVGTRKFFYDVWGDAVNLAARMEQTGEQGKIQISGTIRKLLADEFELDSRGPVKVKGKGTMRTWFLLSRKSTIQTEPSISAKTSQYLHT
jgi:adenylate cyclase